MQKQSAIEKQTEEFLDSGGSLQMLSDINQEDMDTLYEYALELCNSNEIEQAKRIFYLLTTLNHWSYDYCFALATCYQETGEHRQAIIYFGRAAVIKCSDPMAYFYIGVSYYELNKTKQAKESFNFTLKWCQSRSEFDFLQTQCKSYLKKIEQQPDIE